MTAPTQLFGVKYNNDKGESFQVNKKYSDSNEAAEVARKIYTDNPTYRDVRVVDAAELKAWDEPTTSNE